MIAAGQEGSPGRAAEGCRVEGVVLQAAGGQPFRGGHLHQPAERAGAAEADVIEQHEEDVRRPFGRGDLWREVGRGVLVGQADLRIGVAVDRTWVALSIDFDWESILRSVAWLFALAWGHRRKQQAE